MAYLLGKYKNIKIYFVAPPALTVGSDIKVYLTKHKVEYVELESLDAIIPKVDIVYQTRIQKERFKTEKEYKKYKGYYKIDVAIVKKMKTKAIVMHPLPRVDELSSEVDSSPKAAYFKQVKYGLLVRMALLKYVLNK